MLKQLKIYDKMLYLILITLLAFSIDGRKSNLCLFLPNFKGIGAANKRIGHFSIHSIRFNLSAYMFLAFLCKVKLKKESIRQQGPRSV